MARDILFQVSIRTDTGESAPPGVVAVELGVADADCILRPEEE